MLASLALVGPVGVVSAAGPETIVNSVQTLTLSAKKPGQPQIAAVLGNPEREASFMVIKMGRTAFPLHTHNANYQLVVVKGVMRHWDATGSRQSASRMGHGSCWHQPTGQTQGYSRESDECVWFIYFDGVRDFASAK